MSGWTSINGNGFAINGYFAFNYFAHELGHTYGLYHANLSMITKLRWICVLRCFFEQAANGFREGLRLDELTDFGGDLF